MKRLAMIDRWTAAGEANPLACLAMRPTYSLNLVKRGVRPDMVTDQTSAHDPIHGYLPQGWTMAQWRKKDVKRP